MASPWPSSTTSTISHQQMRKSDTKPCAESTDLTFTTDQGAFHQVPTGRRGFDRPRPIVETYPVSCTSWLYKNPTNLTCELADDPKHAFK
jgi:hypothetical protein